MNREFIKILSFVREHKEEDPLRLLLQQSRYPDTDLRLVAQQLEGRHQAYAKWPTLAGCDHFFYPPRLNREQSSSEAAARYKARLFSALGGGILADITGGMGADSFFMAPEAARIHYYEIDPDLCAIAEHNFEALGLGNVVCRCGDSLADTATLPDCDMIFIDPARRDSHGHKVAAFEDCTPNLLDNLQQILSHCRHLLVKASPMMDIRQAVAQLGEVTDVHVVAVDGECKEVLFLISSRGGQNCGRPEIHCVNLDGKDFSADVAEYTFTWEEEACAVPSFAVEVDEYLYEPDAALMKGGCYNSICAWFGVKKLARNTHLYTGGGLIEDFPGRVFRVLRPLTLNAKEVGRALPDGRAHVVVRNYPVSAPDLQKKLKLHEGGSLYVVAATHGTRPSGWLCMLSTPRPSNVMEHNKY